MSCLQVWNSDVSEEQRKQVLSELVSDEPEMRLLYTTPESLRNPTLRSYLKVQYVCCSHKAVFCSRPAGSCVT